MIKRIVEISSPAKLRLQRRQLIVEQDGSDPASVPIEDLALLVLDHSGILYSQALLSACLENNVAVLFCNSRHLPEAALLPLQSNSRHRLVIHQQISVTRAVMERLWKLVVRAKIEAQAEVMLKADASAERLYALARKVKNGDPENIEAQASRYYWPRIFGSGFQRDPNGSGLNALLNFGYALIRAAVARAIVGAGLHPAIGIHHRNQYNPFCLADDLMEPFRPLVDFTVLSHFGGNVDLQLRKETKAVLYGILSQEFLFKKQQYPFIPVLHLYVAEVYRFLTRKSKCLEIPKIRFSADSETCG